MTQVLEHVCDYKNFVHISHLVVSSYEYHVSVSDNELFIRCKGKEKKIVKQNLIMQKITSWIEIEFFFSGLVPKIEVDNVILRIVCLRNTLNLLWLPKQFSESFSKLKFVSIEYIKLH